MLVQLPRELPCISHTFNIHTGQAHSAKKRTSSYYSPVSAIILVRKDGRLNVGKIYASPCGGLFQKIQEHGLVPFRILLSSPSSATIRNITELGNSTRERKSPPLLPNSLITTTSHRNPSNNTREREATLTAIANPKLRNRQTRFLPEATHHLTSPSDTTSKQHIDPTRLGKQQSTSSIYFTKQSHTNEWNYNLESFVKGFRKWRRVSHPQKASLRTRHAP
jgi:hypothetical protein